MNKIIKNTSEVTITDITSEARNTVFNMERQMLSGYYENKKKEEEVSMFMKTWGYNREKAEEQYIKNQEWANSL